MVAAVEAGGAYRLALVALLSAAVGALLCFGTLAGNDAALWREMERLKVQVEQKQALETSAASGTASSNGTLLQSSFLAAAPRAAATVVVPHWRCPVRNIESEVVADRVTASFNFLQKAANCYVLQPMVVTPFFFWAGILLVLQWHVRFRFNRVISDYLQKAPRSIKPLCTWRKLGVNFIILMLYFGEETTRSTKPFVHSLYVIFIDNFVIYYMLGWIAKVVRKSSNTVVHCQYKDVVNVSEETEDDGYVDDKDFATNKFEDITIRFRQLIPIFVVQLALCCFYVEQLNNGGDDDDIKDALSDITKVDAVYWLVSVMFQMYGGGEQLGEAFSTSVWKKYILSTEPFFRSFYSKEEWEAMEDMDSDGILKSMEVFSERQHKEFFHFFDLRFRDEFIFRAFMDFCINGLSRSIIMYTFPIMLCVEGPLDFVKDCTAVLFISTLDDIGDAKPLKCITTKMKFNLLFAEFPKIEEDGQLVPDIGSYMQAGSNLPREVGLNKAEYLYATDDANRGEFGRNIDYAKPWWDLLLSFQDNREKE